MDEMSLLGDALKQQTLEKGSNWLNRIKRELYRLGTKDVRRNGEKNNIYVWREESKRCVDIERQNMKASLKEKNHWYFTMD
jgi:hypothetical protein